MTRTIFPIILNTFREAIRDRILYNLVIFALLVIASAILLKDLTDGQEGRTIVNIGLTAMLFFGVFIAIFVGVGLVSKEIEKRTVYSIFSKPVRRSEFIIGKYLGLCVTLALNVAVMGIGLSLALVFVGSTTLAANIWPAIFLIFLELMVMTGVAMVFSTFSSPALSALLSFLVFVIGHLSSSLRDLGATLGSPISKVVFDAIYFVLPNLSLFTFRTESAAGLTPSANMLGYSALYALLYIVVLLCIAAMIFQKRNFK
jgi:Cu-processing system permease protein